VQDSGLQVAAQAPLPATLPAGGFYVPPTLVADVNGRRTAGAGGDLRPGAGGDPVRRRGRGAGDRQRHAYGLVAGVWTRDGGRQLRMARRLHCGQVFVNNYGAGGGIELPFGGVKHSGHGREKGFEALYGFSTLKTVAIKHD
jgi:aldehyde dehydrogenase (NAD+)